MRQIDKQLIFILALATLIVAATIWAPGIALWSVRIVLGFLTAIVFFAWLDARVPGVGRFFAKAGECLGRAVDLVRRTFGRLKFW